MEKLLCWVLATSMNAWKSADRRDLWKSAWNDTLQSRSLKRGMIPDTESTFMYSNFCMGWSFPMGWRLFQALVLATLLLLPAAWTRAEKTRPAIDEVLKEFQSIVVGNVLGPDNMSSYIGKYGLDPEEIYPKTLYMEDVLNGILGLVIKQMGLEGFAIINEAGFFTVEGVLGERLMAILGDRPGKRRRGVSGAYRVRGFTHWEIRLL